MDRVNTYQVKPKFTCFTRTKVQILTLTRLQGTYHDYAGGEWVNMKAHPQMLAGAAPMQVKEVPKYLWVLQDLS